MILLMKPGLKNKYLTVDYNFSSEIMLQHWVWCGNLPWACAVVPNSLARDHTGDGFFALIHFYHLLIKHNTYLHTILQVK